MKTRELIQLLQSHDPSGTKEVFVDRKSISGITDNNFVAEIFDQSSKTMAIKEADGLQIQTKGLSHFLKSYGYDRVTVHAHHDEYASIINQVTGASFGSIQRTCFVNSDDKPKLKGKTGSGKFSEIFAAPEAYFRAERTQQVAIVLDDRYNPPPVYMDNIANNEPLPEMPRELANEAEVDQRDLE